MTAMHRGRPIVSSFLGLILAVGLGAVPAQAVDEPVPTALTMTGERGHADDEVPLQIDLVQSQDGAPVAGATVVVERRAGQDWPQLGEVVTDEAGHAELPVTLRRTARDNVFRARYDGDALHAGSVAGPLAVTLVRRASRLTVGGPATVIDEQRVEVRVRWTAGGGEPVAGAVRISRKVPGGDWKRFRTVRTGDDGRAAILIRPRTDTRWRGQAARLDWVEGDRSGVHRVDNLPPGRPVVLPAGAPRPRIQLPAQPRAVGAGPNASVSRVPDRVWAQMTGATWHAGCPVGRTQLRLARINYWDYSGYRRRGEFVAHADAVGAIVGALAEMYTQGLPLRSLYRVDRFGWSSRLRGGDDHASMAAGNTSVFNCRDVVNRPGVRSPHSYGRAIDVNTWENPYRSARGTVPNTWWQSRSHPRVAWRSASHRVVAIMGRHGLRWTYGLGDTQHFDARAGNGRYGVISPECGGVCE
jgi:5-hydroxyisourate hydrolase-like protein (transthyretin family)